MVYEILNHFGASYGFYEADDDKSALAAYAVKVDVSSSDLRKNGYTAIPRHNYEGETDNLWPNADTNDYQRLEEWAKNLSMNSHEPTTYTEASNDLSWMESPRTTDPRAMLAALARANAYVLGELVANAYETPMPSEDRQRKINEYVESFGKKL